MLFFPKLSSMYHLFVLFDDAYVEDVLSWLEFPVSRPEIFAAKDTWGAVKSLSRVKTPLNGLLIC